MNARRRLSVLAGGLTIALSMTSAGGYKEVNVADGGTIEGTVTLTGIIPREHFPAVTKDDKVCGFRRTEGRLVSGRGNAVRNAVVWLDDISAGKKPAPAAAAVLRQVHCEYVPHVTLLQQGQPLAIVNNDAVLHNVHAFTIGKEGRTVFNIAQPIKGQKTVIEASRFNASGFYRASCDAGHPWMSAYIVRASHPYYTVTDENGKFVLTHVPPGTYRIRMWHEGIHDAGQSPSGVEEAYECSASVIVYSGTSSTVNFSFAPR